MRKILLVFILLAFLMVSCNLPQRIETQNSVPTVQITDSSLVSGNSSQAITEILTEQPQDKTQTEAPVILFSIGMHVEPFGESIQGYVANNNGDYADEVFFNLHSKYIRTVAEMVAAHGGIMTIQVQSPFTEEVVKMNNPILKDLSAMGFEIGLHFHENAHLGKKSAALPVEKWCEVMQDEINLIKKASGVDEVSYWSGGNLYPQVFQAAACAGLTVNSDWKSPETQSTDMSLQGINPWRPSGGTNGQNFNKISTHDPMGKIIFLPEGQFDREDILAIKGSEAAGGEEAYLAYLEQSLLNSLEQASADKVNVFHFTLHPAEFRGDPSEPFALIDRFLTDVIDPLVASGQVQWATFSQMAEAYKAWELKNPGVDPRD